MTAPHRAGAHLGEWLSPLADGQLPPAQAERALAHVASCRTCAETRNRG